MAGERHPPGKSQPDTDDTTKESPFRVLGIALVADRMGVGARMVFRYPTAPLTQPYEDLFFRLSPRQLAKLFRPKPALCGQPMTLSVGGTVFCCRAVLMEDGNSNSTEGKEQEEHRDGLALFSVIVALAPHVQTSSIPISGWFEGDTEESTGMDRQPSLSSFEGKSSPSTDTGGKASSSFLTIRRVHVSLARLCRVMEREERRCQYVSLQSELFFGIGADMQKKLEDQTVANTSKPPSATASPASLHSKSSHAQGARRGSSILLTNYDYDRDSKMDQSTAESGFFDSQQQEFEQEVIEVCMATNPPTKTEKGIEHQGNMLRELLQVYHALARNDHDFPPTPSLLLTGRDGVVYINRHIAVAVEAVSPCRMAPTESRRVIRPYHTLVFPHASPSELLESLSTPGSLSPRRLQQLLLATNPQKSLHDISTDANLPLKATLEIAAYLVDRGVCLPMPVLAPSSRLACRGIDKIQEQSLGFSQTFGSSVNMFVLVSFLSDSNRTLGQTISFVAESDDGDAVWLRGSLEASLGPHQERRAGGPREGGASAATDNFVDLAMDELQDRMRHIEYLEERLYQMALWLVSHRVLIRQEDYLVAVVTTSTGGSGSGSAATAGGANSSDATPATGALHQQESKVEPGTRLDNVTDDLLYKELMDSGCLGGKVSLQACCWRTGLHVHKLKAFAFRHDQIRIVTRVPTTGDDWGSV